MLKLVKNILVSLINALGGVKAEDPQYIETGDGAEIELTPQAPFVVEPFKTCAGLGRVAIMEGNGVVMLGKVMSID